jgi:histidinol-phosphate phosphatase family protein
VAPAKQTVILAGGVGTRLRARLGDLPKPMINLNGKPLLEYQIELARRYGFTDIKIFACYRADIIREHFGEGQRFGLKISYVVEEEPLGTAGAVLNAYDALAENFLVLYGDTMLGVDLQRIWDRHMESEADATLLLHPNDHPFDSDLVETDLGGWVTAFHNRPHRENDWKQNLVNAGLYVVRRRAVSPWKQPNQAMDFGRDLFPRMLARKAKLLGYPSPEYIKDIGTPERYDRICKEVAAGVAERSALSQSQVGVFLDRDGTVIKEVGGLTMPEQLQLLPGAAEAIKILNHKGLRTILITNQPVVAKGFCKEEDVELIHRKLQTLLGREHAFLDAIYYCPHHPDKGYNGERLDLKFECNCRKPKAGMIFQAAESLNIDLKKSWLIGDTTTDVQTAKNAGLKSVLVRTGHAGFDGKYDSQADLVRENLLDAVQNILADIDW